MAEHDFVLCARLLHERAGIVVGEHRREVLGRILHHHARKFGVSCPREYLHHLQSQPHTEEWSHFINAFTINHTGFFRERHHFDLLRTFVRERARPISVWCCAASTGEEPYTIAMVLAETTYNGESRVFATDIDTDALQKARAGIYTCEQIKPIPETYQHKYLQRGIGSHAGRVRIIPKLAQIVSFQELNLLDLMWSLPDACKFDAIFCRNTMIYFDTRTQARILERFVPVLKSDGLLFVGHSENLTYVTKAFRLRGQTVYVLADGYA